MSQCRGGLAPAVSLCRNGCSGGERCGVVPCAVGRGDRIPGLSGGDDGVQLPQDRRGDDGLRLGGRELVLLPADEVLVTGGEDRVSALVGFQKSATGLDLGFYATRSYSLRRPPRTCRRLIRSRERSATG